MRKLYNINKWLVIITILLCFTFWGGIIALPILGLAQVIMSIKILFHIKELNQETKNLFWFYVILTISLIIIFYILNIDKLEVMLYWSLVSIFLACFHLLVTYIINRETNAKIK